MRNPRRRTTPSFIAASVGTPYAHIHALIPPYQFHLLTLHSLILQVLHSSLPPFSPFIPTRFLPLIAWSFLHSAFSFTFYFTTSVSLSHTHTLLLAVSPFPHASRAAASPRRASHSRKSQSHPFQVFSEDLGPWPYFVPSVSMYKVWSGLPIDWAPLLSFGVAYVA